MVGAKCSCIGCGSRHNVVRSRCTVARIIPPVSILLSSFFKCVADSGSMRLRGCLVIACRIEAVACPRNLCGNGIGGRVGLRMSESSSGRQLVSSYVDTYIGIGPWFMRQGHGALVCAFFVHAPCAQALRVLFPTQRHRRCYGCVCACRVGPPLRQQVMASVCRVCSQVHLRTSLAFVLEATLMRTICR